MNWKMGWKDKVKKKSIILFVGSINKKPRKKTCRNSIFKDIYLIQKTFPIVARFECC